MMQGALAIFQRDVIVFTRDLVSELVTTLANPLTYILIFGLGLGGYIGPVEGVPYLIFVVPGLISMAAVLSAFDDSAWGLWFHRVVQGTIQEYRVNPITTYDIILAKILSGFFKAVVKGTVVAVVLVLWTGFRAEIGHLLLYAVFILIGSVLFTSLGTIVGTLVDSPEAMGRIEAVIVYPLVFLSGVFFPLSVYPASIAPVIRRLPTTALFEGARQSLLRGEFSPSFLGILIVSAAAAFVAAVILFDRRLSE